MGKNERRRLPKKARSGKGSSKESLHKLLTTSALRRQFKINGQIGEPDQKYKISFSSLARQIQFGLTQGYVESEIADGVIRAITPGLVLRSYLETYKDLTLDRLKRILHSHYGVKKHAGVVSDHSFPWVEPEGITPSVLDESLRPKAADLICIE